MTNPTFLEIDIRLGSEERTRMREKMVLWCFDHIPFEDWDVNKLNFIFNDTDSALLFKLTWGEYCVTVSGVEVINDADWAWESVWP